MNLLPCRAGRALALSAWALACASFCLSAHAAGDDAGKIDTGFPGAGMGAAPGAEPPSAATPPPDPAKPIATVNGETVHQSDVDQYLGMLQQQIAQYEMSGRQIPPEQIELLRKGAPIAVVRQKLVDQAAKAEESKITDAELEKEVGNLRAFMKLENHDLDKDLTANGKNPSDLKDEVRKQLALNKIMEDQEGVKPPTDDEIAQAYADTKKQGHTVVPEQVVASHILIGFDGNPREPGYKPPSDAQKAEKKRKAEQVLALAKKGEDFGKLAKENSTDTSNKDKGGSLGAFGRGMMTKNFEDAAFETKPGKLSGVVETEFGYHIIKVEDHIATKTLTLDDLRYQLSQSILDSKVRAKMPALMAELQKKGKIEMLDGSKLPVPPAASEQQ